MGTFNIDIQLSIDATGMHGCHRDKGDGETIVGKCDQPACPDCLTREFIANLKAQGHSINSIKGTIKHWPGQPTQVTDDLATNIRTGKFY